MSLNWLLCEQRLSLHALINQCAVFSPHLNPRPSHISQEQTVQGTDTGLTIKLKVIRSHWKTPSKSRQVRWIQCTLNTSWTQTKRLLERTSWTIWRYQEFTALDVCRIWQILLSYRCSNWISYKIIYTNWQRNWASRTLMVNLPGTTLAAGCLHRVTVEWIHHLRPGDTAVCSDESLPCFFSSVSRYSFYEHSIQQCAEQWWARRKKAVKNL